MYSYLMIDHPFDSQLIQFNVEKCQSTQQQIYIHRIGMEGISWKDANDMQQLSLTKQLFELELLLLFVTMNGRKRGFLNSNHRL